MKKLHFLLLMFVVMWRLFFCESSAFSSPVAEDIAKSYLGKPYVSRPLAENSPPGFDCTTFVEEVLAARHSNSEKVLNSIRYRGGRTDFFDRNHFMEEMWIPNALELGIIVPITLSGEEESSMEVDLAEWFRSNPEIDHKDAAYYRAANEQKRFTASIQYIPATKIDEALLKTLPEETIVFFLRSYPKSPYRWLRNENAVMIVHMGLLFGGCRLYHASSEQKQVTSLDFGSYLRSHSGMCGVAFYSIKK